MLDGQIADFKRDGPGKQPKQPKEKNKDPKQETAKKLQKDIKAFLINNFNNFLGGPLI